MLRKSYVRLVLLHHHTDVRLEQLRTEKERLVWEMQLSLQTAKKCVQANDNDELEQIAVLVTPSACCFSAIQSVASNGSESNSTSNPDPLISRARSTTGAAVPSLGDVQQCAATGQPCVHQEVHQEANPASPALTANSPHPNLQPVLDPPAWLQDDGPLGENAASASEPLGKALDTRLSECKVHMPEAPKLEVPYALPRALALPPLKHGSALCLSCLHAHQP